MFFVKKYPTTTEPVNRRVPSPEVGRLKLRFLFIAYQVHLGVLKRRQTHLLCVGKDIKAGKNISVGAYSSLAFLMMKLASSACRRASTFSKRISPRNHFRVIKNVLLGHLVLDMCGRLLSREF